MNELEICRIWNMNPRKPDGRLHKKNIRLAMERMADCGVSDKVVIHSKETSFVLDVKTGEFTEVTSLKIPPEEIKGSVGAGDAFCAGCLYGICLSSCSLQSVCGQFRRWYAKQKMKL